MTHKNLRTFVITCGLIIVGFALQSAARAQGGARELPVVVTNTTDKPVPVVGGVAVTNSPTVKLDQEANTVRLAPGATVQLYSHHFVWPDVGSLSAGFNVRGYSSVRVCLRTTGNGIKFAVYSVASVPDGSEPFILLDTFSHTSSSPITTCRVYEVPGVSLDIGVSSGSSPVEGTIAVWGR